MLDTKIYNDILCSIKTVEDRQKFLAEIESFLNSLYIDSAEKAILEKDLTPYLADILRPILSEEHRPNNNREIQTFLQEIKEALKLAPIITLHLAFVPSSHSIALFFDFVQSTVGQPVLLHVVYAPSVVGGAILEYKGKYLDLSVARKIERYFETDKKAIIEAIG